jgi:hypothetical protein
MFASATRRDFLRAGAGASLAAAWGLSDVGFLRGLPPLSAQDVGAKGTPSVVPLSPDIEPLVRLLEDTPRDKVLEEVASRIRRGLSYREVLAALFLAGVRNIQPRPSVGFKFHGVLAVNSAHLASLASPDEHRWLPIFWSIDYFKATQQQDVQEGNWTMAPVNESGVPDASKARQAFIQAMDSWDESAADVAAAGVARTAGASDIFELFFRYGARDFRSIGHKAIYASNSFRTLACVGWRYSEPVLRSLAYAMLNHGGEPNPATSDLDADRPGRKNAELVKKLRTDWPSGRLSSETTRDMLGVLRAGSPDEACSLAVELSNKGAHPQSIWDAAMLAGGELLLRQRGIVALHALTSANALRFAYDTSGANETRAWLLLQCLAFLPLFREAMKNRGAVGDVNIVEVEPEAPKAAGKEAVGEIFANVSGDRQRAARQVLAALKSGIAPEELIQAARVLIYTKSNDAHDYKFSSAVLEDYYKVSPEFRNRFLAAGIFNLRGSQDRDTPLVERTKAALA